MVVVSVCIVYLRVRGKEDHPNPSSPSMTRSLQIRRVTPSFPSPPPHPRPRGLRAATASMVVAAAPRQAKLAHSVSQVNISGACCAIHQPPGVRHESPIDCLFTTIPPTRSVARWSPYVSAWEPRRDPELAAVHLAAPLAAAKADKSCRPTDWGLSTTWPQIRPALVIKHQIKGLSGVSLCRPPTAARPVPSRGSGSPVRLSPVLGENVTPATTLCGHPPVSWGFASKKRRIFPCSSSKVGSGFRALSSS
jgi:hypothetical protein